MRKMMNFIKRKASIVNSRAIAVLSNNCGAGYIDQVITILIAVVLGGALLAGLYLLFGDVVLPTLTRKITEMFNYAG